MFRRNMHPFSRAKKSISHSVVGLGFERSFLFFSCDRHHRKRSVLPTDTHTSHTGVHMSSNRSRILIADDHNLVAELCKQLLEPEFQVVGTVNNGRDLVRAAAELKPDVIVVDIAMPVLNGLD